MIGSGKVAELEVIAEEHKADCIIFDRDLQPRVQRNLEQKMDLAVIAEYLSGHIKKS